MDYHNVLWLQVSVDDIFIMHVPEPLDNLFSVVGHLLLRKACLASEIFEQTLLSQLKHQIDIELIMEITVHLQNIGMLHVGLQFNL